MPNATLVLKHLLPLHTIELGYLALYPDDPAQDSYRPESNLFTDSDVITQHLTHFSHILSQTKGSRLHAFLSRAIHSIYDHKTDSRIDISSALCVTRQLRNSEDIFQELCKLPSARRWLERALRRRQDAFLVVGIKTLTDARIEQGKSRGTEAEGAIEVPATVAAAASGVVLPLGDFLDVGAGLSYQKQDNEKTSFVAPGEQIFAVQYRKIQVARFSRPDLEKTSLELGNTWKMYVEGRGVKRGEESIVDARICEYTAKRAGETAAAETFIIDNDEFHFY